MCACLSGEYDGYCAWRGMHPRPGRTACGCGQSSMCGVVSMCGRVDMQAQRSGSALSDARTRERSLRAAPTCDQESSKTVTADWARLSRPSPSRGGLGRGRGAWRGAPRCGRRAERSAGFSRNEMYRRLSFIQAEYFYILIAILPVRTLCLWRCGTPKAKRRASILRPPTARATRRSTRDVALFH